MLGLLNGRYTLISELGTGGFGKTYLAEDAQLGSCVVKQFKPVSNDRKFLEIARRLFDTEVATLRRLGQHDQIPQLLDFFEEEQEFYLVQEFIDGQPLNELIFQRAGLSETEVLELLQDVLSVLEFVHSSHVIHRDIKPGNLIWRRQDRKFVLIDFGAVKEIQTQLLSEGQTNLTIAIGTQGYTPSEQLAGKPRYCSDLYALGVTAIQALTGLQPSQLPDLDIPGWQSNINVSPGLAFILDRLVRSHYSQRYQSATDVLRALQQLAQMPTGLTAIPPSLLLPDYLSADRTELPGWRSRLQSGLQAVTIAAVAVTGLLFSVRQLGWVEPLELKAFDQMVQMNCHDAPDPRILLVGISESDLRLLQRSTPSDQSVAQVLETLQRYQPRVIGLDLHRELPQLPGHAALLHQLGADNTIAITDLGTDADTRIPPPSGIPADRVGFNDIAIDADGVVRRNLMFATDKTGTFYAFSLRLALNYLATRNILPRKSAINPDFVQIGSIPFVPLEPTSGGYQAADAGGYQILLRYRSPQTVAQQISFTDVLRGKLDPRWVKDKIVLIGTIAPSAKDLFYTPYSAAQQTVHQMSGVVIHAQMTSQILAAVLDGQQPFWFWSDGVEVLWILGWAAIGGSLALWLRHPLLLGGGSIAALVILFGVVLLIFTRQGWVPIAAPAIALVVTGATVAAYQTYLAQAQRHKTQIWFNSSANR